MTAHAIEFREQHAHPNRALRNVIFNSEESFNCHRENQFVIERTQVVHARDIGATLHVREFFAGLFHTGVQVTDDGLATQNFLTLKFEHESQYTVSTGVLRSHVDDHRLIFVGISRNLSEFGNFGFAHAQDRTNLAQNFFRTDFATRAHFLGAFICSEDIFNRCHEFDPLNCTGMRPIE